MWSLAEISLSSYHCFMDSLSLFFCFTHMGRQIGRTYSENSTSSNSKSAISRSPAAGLGGTCIFLTILLGGIFFLNEMCIINSQGWYFTNLYFRYISSWFILLLFSYWLKFRKRGKSETYCFSGALFFGVCYLPKCL